MSRLTLLPTPVAAACALLGSLTFPAHALANTERAPAPAGTPAIASASQRIDVMGTSPLAGQGVPRDLLPYSVQVQERAGVDASLSDNTLDLLARRASGVQVNDIQGSPYQGDLTYRGYRASGLLGAAQGLSVYLDGVRMNEPFGDVVNWDLLPEFAFGRVMIVGGANPLYGLNTLGGAVVVETLDGRRAPGVRGEFRLGSFGRRAIGLSHGSSNADGQTFLSVGSFREKGWRQYSEGELSTLLFKASRRTEFGEFGLNVLGGRSRLVGNGLVPLYTFEEDGLRTDDLGALQRNAVYTHPDQTRNRLGQGSLRWSHSTAAGDLLEAMAYGRSSQRRTLNGDEAEEPQEDLNAALNRTQTTQRATGLWFAHSGRRGEHRWQWSVHVERSRVSYRQTEQEGRFDATRGVLPSADEQEELSAQVVGDSRTMGLHLTDTWRITTDTALTATLGYSDTRVRNTLTSVDDDTDEVRQRPTEQFSYRSWNPSLGITQRLGSHATLFANLTRNTRVPTVIELGCADPAEPCRLPIGLQADPYLKPVRATTQEVGLRWLASPGIEGSVALYRTDNHDDILFSSVSVTGQRGYFRNFDRTRHQGMDLDVNWRRGAWQTGVAYSHLQATYEVDGVLRIGQRNVQVHPGTRLAGLPQHLVKGSLDWTPGAWGWGLDLQWTSARVSAGNEDGRIEDDEDTRLILSVPASAVLNLRSLWKSPTVKGLEVGLALKNALDRRGASYGALAETRFDARGRYSGQERDALFVAPAAPRSLSVTVRLRF